MLQIHKNIKQQLKYFYENGRIPNIIFNGTSGSGKSTIVGEFISLIYGNKKEMINDYVMYVNCAHGKGIKFIREELKFFAKMNINSQGNLNLFKTIVLLNGDKLTMDAQSALRRCIELFSHNTRFFVIVEDKNKLLNPILSRFCEIYIPEPEYRGKPANLYKYNAKRVFNIADVKAKKMEWLKKTLKEYKNMNQMNNDNDNDKNNDTLELVIKLYERGYFALDIIKLVETNFFQLEENRKCELLLDCNKVRYEIRQEKLLMFYIIEALCVHPHPLKI